jgi:hypothetical protein
MQCQKVFAAELITSAIEFAPVAAVKVVFIAVREAAIVMTAGKTLRAPLARVLL